LNGGVLGAALYVTLLIKEITFLNSVAGSQGGSLYLGNYIYISLISVVIDNSYSGGDGAFLEFKT